MEQKNQSPTPGLINKWLKNHKEDAEEDIDVLEDIADSLNDIASAARFFKVLSIVTIILGLIALVLSFK